MTHFGSSSKKLLLPALALGVLGFVTGITGTARSELKSTPALFAAYALSDKKGIAWAFGQVTQAMANDKALKGCGGAKAGCKIVMQVHARCIAYAESFHGGYWIGTSGAGDAQQARKLALDFCGENAPQKTCRIRHSSC